MPTEPSAKVLLDHISRDGIRVITFEATYHRIVLAEVNTHRALSRNSESSRAVPIEKKLDRFKNDPAWPLAWLSDAPGMNAGGELTGKELLAAKQMFNRIREHTAREIEDYLALFPEREEHLSKGWLNRPMEWLQWHTTIITATDDPDSLENLFDQRAIERTKGAQLEFGLPAQLMLEAMRASTPTLLRPGEWHTPLILPGEAAGFKHHETLAISAARCARISYLNQHGHRQPARDIALFEDLINADPKHYSPLEHVCTPADMHDADYPFTHRGNLVGYTQLRHKLDEVGMYIHAN